MRSQAARAALLAAVIIGAGGGYGCRRADDSAAGQTAQKPAAPKTSAKVAGERTAQTAADKTPPVSSETRTTNPAKPPVVVGAAPSQLVKSVAAEPAPRKSEEIAQPKTARKARTTPSSRPPLLLPGMGLKITTVADQEVNDAEADLVAKWNKIQSVAAVMRTELRQDKTKTRRLQIRDTVGRFSAKKKDGVTLVKFVELRRSQVERAEDDWVLMGQRTTFVSDGRYAYVLDELPKTVTAVKQNLPLPILHIGGPRLFRDIHSFYGVRLDKDEVVDEKTARVFEVARRGGSFTGRYYIDAETGLLLKLEVNNERDKYHRQTTVSEVVIDATFSEDHFTLQTPDGVELEDKTK